MKRTILTLLALLLPLGGLALPRASASTVSTTALGETTNALPDSYDPLANFHYIRTSPRQSLRPELLFFGVDLQQNIEAERWPVVKALDQFGSFSGVTAWPNFCQPGQICNRTFPGFDMVHALYRSRYVAFVDKDLLNVDLKPLAKLSAGERRLFDKFSNPLGARSNLYNAASAAANTGDVCCSKSGLPLSTKSLPLVVVGGYAQTWPTSPLTTLDFTVLRRGVLTPTPCLTNSCLSSQQPLGRDNASFSDVQESLITGKPAGGLSKQLIYDVNVQTNVIVALICHADGKKPASVCDRSVIRTLLNRVK